MSTRFHSKFHRHNHHTDPTLDVKYPDSSNDPIASPASPFRGAFVLNGSLSAYTSLSAYSGYFSNPNTAMILRGGVWALAVDQGNTLVRDITCSNIVINGNFSLNGDAYFKENVYITKNLAVNNNTLFVNASSNKVGVGTSTPNQSLTVVGNVSSTQGLYSGSIFEVNPLTPKINLKTNTSVTGNFDVSNDALVSNKLTVTGNTELQSNLNVASNALTVNAGSRFVGINTAFPPTTQLEVNGNALITQNATVNSNLNVDSGTLFVDANTNKVGINTVSPSHLLTVNGSALVTDSQYINNNLLVGAPVNHWIPGSTYIGITNQGQIDSSEDGEITFTVNGYRNNSGSNVGVPSADTWVSQSANNFGLDGAAQIGLGAGGSIDLRTESSKPTGSTYQVTNRLRVTSTGEVGIGTVTPNKQLTVIGSISATEQIAASALFVSAINLVPTEVNLISDVRTFTTPVTATGDFLVVNVNGAERAIRLWNF
jgi:hypothetical protein